jgi:iron(III) transport system permease protein
VARDVRRVALAEAGAAASPLTIDSPNARFVNLTPLVWGLAALVLTGMVVLPIGWIFWSSLHADRTEVLTLGNYVEAFSRTIYLEPIRNSLVLAASVGVLSVVFGTVLAWLVARTDMPAAGMVRLLVFAAFVTPSFLGAIAWIFLAAPNSGWLNRGWIALTGAQRGPFDIYSLPGAIFVITLYSFPYTFNFVATFLETIPSDMERAAALLGASWWRTLLRITLPLVRPAIIAGGVMSFLEALAEFGTPAFLLIPARQQVITTQLYLFFQYPTRPNMAAAYAIPLLLVAVALFSTQQRLLSRGRYTTLGGRGLAREPVRLGRWRWPALALCLVPPLLALVLPYAALLGTSLSKAWGKGPVAGNLTLDWYGWAFQNVAARAAIMHSLTYAAAAATIALVLASFTAYVSARRLLPGARWLGFLAKAPFVVPGIVLAIGFFSAYARPPIVLYGTAAMLIVAFATRFLPIAYSGSETALRGLDPDLEHAARTLGCGQLRTFWRVVLPLLRRTLLMNWLLVFIPSLRELSSAIFLFTPATAVMSTLIFDLSDAGNYEPVSTLGILMMLLTFGMVTLAYRVVGRAMFAQRRAT